MRPYTDYNIRGAWWILLVCAIVKSLNLEELHKSASIKLHNAVCFVYNAVRYVHIAVRFVYIAVRYEVFSTLNIFLYRSPGD